MMTTIDDACDRILSCGYAKVRLGTSAVTDLARVFEAAQSFFARPADAKARCASQDFNHGYRPLGQEFSVTPDRPDLNECFALWSNRTDMIPHADQAEELIHAIESWRDVLAPFVRDLVDALARHFDAGAGPAFARASYVQLNQYASRVEGRDLLQDRHEDGHLLTVHHATAPGLEIFDAGVNLPMDTGLDEVLVMPGSVLTDLTRGKVEPLFHQVRNLGLAERSALMYFVNPELDEPLYAWGSGDEEAHVDLRERVRSNPGMFGLPVVPAL